MLPLPLRETIAFLERFLPPPPARILEIGCGDGSLTLALSDCGYRATGLDESPRSSTPSSKQVQWITADFLFYEADIRYDAIVFARSLHHMPPTGRALERAQGLLEPDGIVLAEEFAYDRVNVHTARWLYDLESVLVSAEIVEPPPREHAAERRPLARWRQEHIEDPPLVTGHDMLAAARDRFELLAVEEAPYLYRYFVDRMAPGERSERVLETVFELESRLVRERDIAAAGVRFVGRVRA